MSRYSHDLFHYDEDDEGEEVFFYEPGELERCTPERLLAFLKDHRLKHGKPPTLRDIKQKFGGIIGPMIDYWNLKDRKLI